MAIANALQLETARCRAFPIPFIFVSRAKFELAQFICCRLRAFLLLIRYVTQWPWTLTLWPWPLTLNTCKRRASPRSNSVRNLSEIEQSVAELLQFEHLTLWHWTCITHCAMLWDSLHKVYTQSSYEFMKCNNFLMLIRHITVWPWPLTRWPWKFAVDLCHVVIVCSN